MWWSDQIDPDGLSQGDIVDELVFANVYPLTPVERKSVHGHSGWVVLPNWPTKADHTCHVAAIARKGLGLILSHSCDIDKKNKKSRIFTAPLAPLSDLTGDQQIAVLEQLRVSLFPLLGTRRGDLYADLRLAVALDQRLFEERNRIASMTEEGRKRLQVQLVKLFTRLED